MSGRFWILGKIAFRQLLGLSEMENDLAMEDPREPRLLQDWNELLVSGMYMSRVTYVVSFGDAAQAVTLWRLSPSLSLDRENKCLTLARETLSLDGKAVPESDCRTVCGCATSPQRLEVPGPLTATHVRLPRADGRRSRAESFLR